MKTYQECVREYDDSIPHKADLYMLGFLDAITTRIGRRSLGTYRPTGRSAITSKRRHLKRFLQFAALRTIVTRFLRLGK